ncbi:MAG TPA: SDR family oxidoreductase [Devosiaceae bacterium]|jgi:hypothetical protein|nr:SDR family oxidoreductase [Devosiaceae bacterium]
MRDIEIDLAGNRFVIIGEQGPLRHALATALRQNGGASADTIAADLVIALYPLQPEDGPVPDLLPDLREHGQRMAAGSGGRLIMVISALASVPARRHPDYSAQMAFAWAGMRGLSMTLAPKVLVNAVGVGLVEDEGALLAGDRIMLGHAGLPRPGSVAEVVNAVLFLSDPANTYTTGQLLNVDGGWTVGYGRNF